MSSKDADRVTSALLGTSTSTSTGADKEQIRQDQDAAASGSAGEVGGSAGNDAAAGEDRGGPEPVAPGEAVPTEKRDRLFSEEGPPEEDAPPPPHIVELARAAPDSVIFASDPTWQGGDPPPEWAVIGWWTSDEAGEVAGWEDNGNYRPSPWSLGWPRPVDDVDAAAQLAATGYGPVKDVSRALAAAAEVAVVLEGDGTPALAAVPDGGTSVPVFTMPPHPVEADLPVHRTVPVAELTDVVGERPLLYLSFTAPASVVVEMGDVLAEVDRQKTATEADVPGSADVSVPRSAVQP
ncbi:type VII secretion system-associated protein [Streptomyces sp. NEAU-W12]|uniref:type VII secretion system-associated protein n=1 Tax=Streptomyces sp. NEAU-W12 TaxID=2994668 RepID=UPI00224B3C31|nr:type VII secretion system-associated protein [Streptomyces sp. NEAU-W12]MCX2928413.1 type VII secretion system-associated protein [Streptomyces sp. NEAU-W12]